MNPLLYIFDADDTLRRTLTPGRPCPYHSDDWELLPAVRERLARIDFGPRGARLAIVSNQDHVGYGHLTFIQARRLLQQLARAAAGPCARRPFIALCPHRLRHPCPCRKPAPGMLLAALAHFDVAPSQAVFVGDAPSDRAAAARAGVRFISAAEFFKKPFESPVGRPRVPGTRQEDAVSRRLSQTPP